MRPLKVVGMSEPLVLTWKQRQVGKEVSWEGWQEQGVVLRGVDMREMTSLNSMRPLVVGMSEPRWC